MSQEFDTQGVDPHGSYFGLHTEDGTPIEQAVSHERLLEFRLRYLIRQNTSLSEQTSLADAKAGAILVAITFFFTYVAADLSPKDVFEPLSVLENILMAVASVAALGAVIPRRVRALLESEGTSERFSWVGLSARRYKAQDYADSLQSLDFVEMGRQLGLANHAMARTLRRKLRFVRIAFAAAAVGYALFVFAHDPLDWLGSLNAFSASLSLG